jgi:hypothetical protein
MVVILGTRYLQSGIADLYDEFISHDRQIERQALAF